MIFVDIDQGTRFLKQIKLNNDWHVAFGKLKTDVSSDDFHEGDFKDLVSAVSAVLNQIDEVQHWEMGPIHDGNQNYFVRRLQTGGL